ncbi:hypothetical protein [Bacillus sp. EB600]|nr:hypothetical protein [Bacillus sp. EB600]MCQ6282158.1 hypothetical protein [Bacillus sp. EB600]
MENASLVLFIGEENNGGFFSCGFFLEADLNEIISVEIMQTNDVSS